MSVAVPSRKRKAAPRDVALHTNKTKEDGIPLHETLQIHNVVDANADFDSSEDELEGKDEEWSDEDSLENGSVLQEDDEVSQEGLSEEDHDDADYMSKSLRPYREVKDANGNPRYLYDEIEPVYDSDDSDAPPGQNTIGNIPLSFYETYPHIGYDINGKKVMRPAKGTALDSLLDSIEIPEGWTGLTDPATGKPLELSAEELDVLRRLTRNEASSDGYDPYPEMVEYFSGKLETMPLSSAPEPKRRFVPSKHEAKRVMKMVKAIREGRIQPYRPPDEVEGEDAEPWRYDVWADEAPRADHPMNMPAPKLPPPGYDESYRPPPEYVPDEEERKAWNEADEEDRTRGFLPASHDALRKVPAFPKFVNEKFERCLDLYLAPRTRITRPNFDPESLLPKLPRPEDLKPYPEKLGSVFSGHTGRVRCVAVDPRGTLAASGGDDGTVRIWHLDTATEIWRAQISDSDPIRVVKWRPSRETTILAAAAGESIFLIAPDLADFPSPSEQDAQRSRDLLDQGWTAQQQTNGDVQKARSTQWMRPERHLRDIGVLVQVTVRESVQAISWHRRGDHFATVSPRGQHSALVIHTLSKHLTQRPVAKLRGLTQYAQFHPTKPILFVASQQKIRMYDLEKQELLRTLQPGASWISSFDVHPGGENLVVSSHDKRLSWMDVELSATPHKIFRNHHKRGIRAAKFHQGGKPLFADASDDGTIQIFHGKVSNDPMENATIVPLIGLSGHSTVDGLGVMDLDWHPEKAICVSAGADGTCRVWTE